MLIKVLFAQEKESYPGEYAPTALEVVTEYDYDENPDWLDKILIKYRNTPEYTHVAVIDIEINDEDLDARLYPNETTIDGKIVK
jgi:hypothetical protein